MDVIAERRLEALYPDIGLTSIHLRIGRPVPRDERDWSCPVQVEGLRLWHGFGEFAGVDSWQALLLALGFVQAILSAEAERGVVFHWESSEDAISIEELFSLGKIE